VALVVDVEPVIHRVVLEIGDEPRDIDDGQGPQPATPKIATVRPA
jgi:hypothetical protein